MLPRKKLRYNWRIMETIFAKIIKREIPAHIVYEDDLVLAFLDIEPVNPGHTLIIPKKTFVNIFDGDEEYLAHMIKVSKKIALALKAAGLAEGVNLIMNNEAEAGQKVFHSHLHVVPRKKDDGAYQSPKHTPCIKEELASIKEQLKQQLN